MSKKRRVQLWLTGDLIERGQAAAKRLPDVTLSRVVDELLAGMVPILEAIADDIGSEPGSVADQRLAQAFGEPLMRMVKEMGENET